LYNVDTARNEGKVEGLIEGEAKGIAKVTGLTVKEVKQLQ